MFEKDITMLINVTDDIYDTYLALINLEMANNKNSEKYENLLESLKQEISIFNSILNRISLDYHMSLDVYNYLISLDRFKSLSIVNKKLSLSFTTKIEQRDEMVLAYIKNRIYQKLLQDADYTLATEKSIPEEMKDDAIIGEVKKVLEFKNEYQYSIINDIYMLFLAIIAKKKNIILNHQDVLDKFTKIKYSYGFILPVLEENLINNNFEVDTKPYIVHHTVASFYRLSEKSFASSKKAIVLSTIVGNIGFIKYLYDANLQNHEMLALAINTEAIIRACLVVADVETRDIILNVLNSLASSLSLQSSYQKITAILKNIPNKINDDLSLAQIVSIGRI